MISGSKVVVIAYPGGWSGIPKFCVDALKREVEEVVVLGTLNPEQRHMYIEEMKLRRSRFGRLYLPDRDLALLKLRAAEINQDLKLHPDAAAVIVFHPPDAAFLETDIPIAIIHDATWRQFTSTYPGFLQKDLMEETYQSGFIAERMAFEKASLLLLMSRWAADSVAREYPWLKDNIHVVLPGANLPEEIEYSDMQEATIRRTMGQCRLLFVGVEVYRKGLDIAIETVKSLNAAGISATLNVVGIKGERFEPNSDVRVWGNLNKDSQSELALLSQLYRESFVLVLPSRAECAGIVLCEAAAFGVPTIVPRVGGMPEIVVHGKTGYVLASEAIPADYVRTITRLWRDPDLYRELCEDARVRYKTLLSWRQYAKSLLKLLDLST